MSRLQFKREGNTLQGPATSDLDQKLTYQQLLKLNHDLAKENLQLKNVGNRLGNQLRSLHTQFQIKPRQENTELYHAIGMSPELHQFQNTLTPLLEAYENKIQQFQHGFQTMHEEFFLLEKKFEEVCRENEELKASLTDKSKELLEVYRDGVSSEMQADFGHLILQQINQKQKVLVQENALLDKNYQKYQSEAERAKSDLESTKQRLEEARNKLREVQISQRQLTAQVNSLKQTNFELQIKNNELEAEKRKIQQAHDRAQSQNNQINKEKELYMNKLDDLRRKIENDRSIPSQGNQSKYIEELQTKIAFLQAEQGPNDHHKKLTKLQRDYDKLYKQKKQLKEAYESIRINEQSLKKEITENRDRVRELESAQRQLEVSESRLKKSLQTLTQKSKADIIRSKRDNKQDMDRLEADFKRKLEAKDRKISQIDENLEKIRLQRDKLEKQNSLHNDRNVDNTRGRTNKQNDRNINKMKDKLKIHEQFFREQTQIYEQDLKSLRSQYDSLKADNKSKNQELRKLKAAYDQLSKQHQDLCKSKEMLILEFKSVRDQYQFNLKDKQRIFDEKILQIKAVVQQSENKRRQQRQRVQQASKQYKRVLEDIKSAYEARIRDLEGQVTEVHYRTQITPAR